MTNKTDERRKTAILSVTHNAKPTWIFSDFLAEIIVEAIRADDEVNGMVLVSIEALKEALEYMRFPATAGCAKSARHILESMLADLEKESTDAVPQVR